MEPPAAARINATTILLMKKLLSRGTNGNPGYTPYEGRRQVSVLAGARRSRRRARRHLWLWVASLSVGAVATAVGLVTRGLHAWEYLSRSPSLPSRLPSLSEAESGINRYMEESISLLADSLRRGCVRPIGRDGGRLGIDVGCLACGAVSAGGRLYIKWATTRHACADGRLDWSCCGLRRQASQRPTSPPLSSQRPWARWSRSCLMCFALAYARGQEYRQPSRVATDARTVSFAGGSTFMRRLWRCWLFAYEMFLR